MLSSFPGYVRRIGALVQSLAGFCRSLPGVVTSDQAKSCLDSFVSQGEILDCYLLTFM